MNTILLAIILSSAGTAAPAEKELGAGVTAGPVTEIADIVQEPVRYSGQNVRVTGQVVDVCTMAGCWMELSSGDASIRLKVDDGVIVFPQEAKGQTALAEGKVEVIDMSRDDYLSWAGHEASERGEKFEPQSIGDPPYRVVRIRATGAVLK